MAKTLIKKWKGDIEIEVQKETQNEMKEEEAKETKMKIKATAAKHRREFDKEDIKDEQNIKKLKSKDKEPETTNISENISSSKPLDSSSSSASPVLQGNVIIDFQQIENTMTMNHK